MKRILYVTNYKPGKGGISGQVDYLMRFLPDGKEYYADIFSTYGSVFQRILFFFSLFFRVRKYDIVHIHGCSGYGFLPIVYGMVAGKLWRRKVIVTYHGGGAEAFFARHPHWVRFWLMKADERVVLSGFLRAVFDKYGIPSCIIPNVVELKDDVFVERKEILPKFISMRHLRDLYNIPCILRAFERVQKQVPEAELVLLGDGDKKKELESYVVEHGLKSVRFIGHVPNEKIGDYLQKSDVMLSSPREDNMPVSLLEAFSAGLLVITSNVGGVPYMVEHGRTGLLFESDNDSDMADQMLWALSHQSESLQIIKNAKEEVKQYSWEVVGQQIKSLYE